MPAGTAEMRRACEGFAELLGALGRMGTSRTTWRLLDDECVRLGARVRAEMLGRSRSARARAEARLDALMLLSPALEVLRASPVRLSRQARAMIAAAESADLFAREGRARRRVKPSSR